MESQEAELREAMVALLPRLRRFAHALTGAQADADDLVQAGLERALRSLAQFEPGTRLDSWLFRVLRNAWIDEVRARGRQEKIFAPAEAGESIGISREAERASGPAARSCDLPVRARLRRH